MHPSSLIFRFRVFRIVTSHGNLSVGGGFKRGGVRVQVRVRVRGRGRVRVVHRGRYRLVRVRLRDGEGHDEGNSSKKSGSLFTGTLLGVLVCRLGVPVSLLVVGEGRPGSTGLGHGGTAVELGLGVVGLGLGLGLGLSLDGALGLGLLHVLDEMPQEECAPRDLAECLGTLLALVGPRLLVRGEGLDGPVGLGHLGLEGLGSLHQIVIDGLALGVRGNLLVNPSLELLLLGVEGPRGHLDEGLLVVLDVLGQELLDMLVLGLHGRSRSSSSSSSSSRHVFC